MWLERQHDATDRQLRQFAAALIVVAGIAAGRLWWHQGSLGAVASAALSGATLLGLLGLIAPRRIAWLFLALTAITWPIGAVVSELMLLLLYFAVMTPMALVMRAAGRDPLHRAIDRRAPTYWADCRPTRDQSRYLRQS